MCNTEVYRATQLKKGSCNFTSYLRVQKLNVITVKFTCVYTRLNMYDCIHVGMYVCIGICMYLCAYVCVKRKAVTGLWVISSRKHEEPVIMVRIQSK